MFYFIWKNADAENHYDKSPSFLSFTKTKNLVS